LRRLPATLFAPLACLLLVACASGGPAPVEERNIQQQVRLPASEGSAGVQVYPLQNPAVAELTAQAESAEAAGDLGQASVLLERALRIQPRDPKLLQHMAEVQLQRQDYQQALSFAIRSHDIGPRVGELCARNWRTVALSREGLGDQAGAAQARERSQQCTVSPPSRL
jgi:tetratricopeptide (TPR) repeat protein